MTKEPGLVFEVGHRLGCIVVVTNIGLVELTNSDKSCLVGHTDMRCFTAVGTKITAKCIIINYSSNYYIIGAIDMTMNLSLIIIINW